MSSLKLATSSWSEEEYTAIQKVIDTGMFSMSEHVFKFEKEFAKFTGSKYCVMVNSGSSANLIATAALFYTKENALKPGDEVIVPAVSWSTTYFPLYQYGLKLKFVDIDPDTLNFDLESLKNAISPETKMIMAVNLLGNSNDFNYIRNLINKQNIILIEDNCESMGATLDNKQTGTFGKMGTFSTFFSHHISTMEGGMIVTDDEELHQILLCLRAHGWTRNLPKNNLITGTKSDDPFEESFKFVLPGYNLRPLEMSGAIGSEQLKKLPNLIQKRRENAKIFVDLFHDNSKFSIQKEIGHSSWFGFSFIIKDGVNLNRKKIIKILEEEKVECRPIVTGNFAKNEVVEKYFNYSVHNNLSNADHLDANGFFIGNHHVDIKEGLHHLKKVIEKI